MHNDLFLEPLQSMRTLLVREIYTTYTFRSPNATIYSISICVKYARNSSYNGIKIYITQYNYNTSRHTAGFLPRPRHGLHHVSM
jgi:hypothetical protein